MAKVKIQELIRLKEAGYSQTDIANACHSARSTVQDYLKMIAAAKLVWTEAQGMSEGEIRERLGIGRRVSKDKEAQVNYELIHQEMNRKGVTLKLLWQESREVHSLGYSTFARGYRRWRQASKASMRLNYKPGEWMFVDYAGLTVPIVGLVTGIVSEAQVFVSCLGASDKIFCEATPSQELFYWIGSHERALRFYGGATSALVPDNLKCGVTKAFWYEPDLNRTYQDFAEYYHIAVLPARSRKPRDKAKVEKAVQEVERWVLAPLRNQVFHSVAELNEAMKPLLSELNNRIMRDYGASRQELFTQNELPALKPLPEQPYSFAIWKRAKVNLDYHVELDRHRYSVPYWFIHREVEIKATEHTIEVFFDAKRVAAHKRSRVINGFTTLPEHMPPHHAEVRSWTAERFLDWAGSVGQQTQSQVRALLDSRLHEQQAFRSILGLQRLADKFGTTRLEAACTRANHFKLLGVKSICSILEKSQDRIQLVADAPVAACQHENLRGDDYYH